jgi:hypothetical protein
MLKMWMEEYVPGYFIKYDGFRENNQFTVLSPEGRVADVDTLENARSLLVRSGGYFGHKISCKIHFPHKGQESKWCIAEYKGDHVCVMVEFSDGYLLVDLGGDSEGNQRGLEITHKSDLT